MTHLRLSVLASVALLSPSLWAQEAPATPPAPPQTPAPAPAPAAAPETAPETPAAPPATEVAPEAAPPVEAQPPVGEMPAAPDPAPLAEAPAEVTEEVALEEKSVGKAGYDKKFFLESADGNFRLDLEGRLQVRFTYENEPGDTPDDSRVNAAHFAIQRGRVTLAGHAFDPNLRYKFQMDLGRGAVTLKDYWLEPTFNEWVSLRAGQTKRPFSRQAITSSGRLEFVDRAITTAFSGGRDIGVMLNNRYEKSPNIEYAAGVFNGTGDGQGDAQVFQGDVVVDPATGEGEVTSGRFRNTPANFKPTLAARFGLNFNGVKGYSESDLEGGAEPRFAVAAAGLLDLNADNSDSGALRGTIDYMFKMSGFSSTGAVFIESVQDGDDVLGDRAYAAWGALAQVGYVVDGHIEPALRWAIVDPDGDDNSLNEFTAGLNYFFHAHHLKLQADGSLLSKAEADADNSNDWRARLQAQLVF